jgi:predicted dinucleotide-binding enzyme
MKIAIIGTGRMGATLIRKLSAAGHAVRIANSRGPDTIRDLARETGTTAMTSAEAVQDVELVIVSVPFNAMVALKPLLNTVSNSVPIADTSNYLSSRDGHIEALDAGETESVWMQEQLGRPLIKAWNALVQATLQDKGKTKAEPGRLAVPVAGDDPEVKQIVMNLVEDTGFDAVDAGTIEESWRIQAGSPAYCTELTAEELEQARTLADREAALKRRDAIADIISSWPIDDAWSFDHVVALHRAATRFPRQREVAASRGEPDTGHGLLPRRRGRAQSPATEER